MSMLSQSNNPMGLMQTMLGNNPAFGRAMEMAQGKSPEQLKSTVFNLAQQRGISQQQLIQMANQLGIKL